jgi:two-component system sensor histidine kinase RegB
MSTAPRDRSTRRLLLRNWSIDTIGRKNMLLLIQLRWLAVAGQLVTILIVHFAMGVRLPLAPMLAIPATAVALNLVSLAVIRRRKGIANAELFLALTFDVMALTVQLYLSGGATNPFISLYLLHVVIGAILLDRRTAWTIAMITICCGGFLAMRYQTLDLPDRLDGLLFDLHIAGEWICSVLIAVLLVFFVARINTNLKERDVRLADLRQQAAEEDHIVRMGLLASGAAHELGTPLSSLAVILGDWRRMPELARDPQLSEEIDEMQAAVQRCKTIVTGILLSSGEARGEAPAVMTAGAFLEEIVQEWRNTHPQVLLSYRIEQIEAMRIVADPVIRQVITNVLDNAGEASGDLIALTADRTEDMLRIAVEDDGPGFTPEMLANFGKPYRSSKGRLGSGLGLFLVVNVMRKLGGAVIPANAPRGGATVMLSFPLAILEVEEGSHVD